MKGSGPSIFLTISMNRLSLIPLEKKWIKGREEGNIGFFNKIIFNNKNNLPSTINTKLLISKPLHSSPSVSLFSVAIKDRKLKFLVKIPVTYVHLFYMDCLVRHSVGHDFL